MHYQPTPDKQIVFRVLSFPSTLNDCFHLDVNIRNPESISLFKDRLLFFIRPVQSNIYNILTQKS